MTLQSVWLPLCNYFPLYSSSCTALKRKKPILDACWLIRCSRMPLRHWEFCWNSMWKVLPWRPAFYVIPFAKQFKGHLCNLDEAGICIPASVWKSSREIYSLVQTNSIEFSRGNYSQDCGLNPFSPPSDGLLPSCLLKCQIVRRILRAKSIGKK